jgi:hypothetical protein
MGNSSNRGGCGPPFLIPTALLYLDSSSIMDTDNKISFMCEILIKCHQMDAIPIEGFLSGDLPYSFT